MAKNPFSSENSDNEIRNFVAKTINNSMVNNRRTEMES